jgi:hypothetical protein
MTSHELARELLKCEDLEVTASLDISTGDDDSGRRIFTNGCFGVNNFTGDAGVITILFDADPKDNYGELL